jgi:hypothetical protein
MKRIALLAVIAGSLMALPSTAAAQTAAEAGCTGPVEINHKTPPATASACVDVGGAGGEIVVADEDSCTYINAWSSNPGTPGYAGLCTGAVSRGPSCTTATDSDPDNTGGCFQIKDAPAPVNAALNTAPVSVVTGTFICGNTTGEDPKNTTAGGNPGRDGCAIP